MTPYEINNAIISYLEANWNDTSIRKIGEQPPDVPFIEAHLIPAQTESLEIMGASEQPGVIMINIFTRGDAGVDEGWVYAGGLEDLFWNTETSNIYFENDGIKPYSKHLGIDDDLQARHFQVVVPYSILREA